MSCTIRNDGFLPRDVNAAGLVADESGGKWQSLTPNICDSGGMMMDESSVDQVSVTKRLSSLPRENTSIDFSSASFKREQ
jgi:hypothetical protein